MRHSRKYLSLVVALGIVGTLAALGPAALAGEPKVAATKPAAALHRITDVTLKRGVISSPSSSAARRRTGNSVAVESLEIAHEGFSPSSSASPAFNPKELAVEQHVPWKK